jgi:hypothetical protein
MMQWNEMGRGLGKAAVVLAATVAVAAPAVAQNVRLYKGTLQIGFGDPENQTLPPGGTPEPDLANNGVPACANANPFLPATMATVNVHGYVDEGAGAAPRSLMFDKHAPVNWAAQSGGGMAPIVNSTCIVQFPPWLANNVLRSRVQQGAQVWPGNALNAGATAFTTGAGGGTVSDGGGVPAPVVYNQTFYGAVGGQIEMVPGPNNFGGGVPVNGGGAVQLGINLARTNGTGMALETFGIIPYVNALLPTGPAAYGTDGRGGPAQHLTGIGIGNPYTWVGRTPGPMGQASTIPLTPNGGWQQGAPRIIQVAPGVFLPLTTKGDFRGLFHKWTTGMVKHTDMSGNYTTDRTATGHDWTTMQFPGSVMADPAFGTTRKLQLVSPWSASIKKRGTGPFKTQLAALPDLGFGGLAILTLDVAPVPEPGMLSAIGFGVIGLLGLGAARGRRR